ncbi:MAG: hypothetical protein Q8K78_17985 [Planctomycetaceae bacterium]|nr:hypothetical protein [Planctomycetaceae bacterium]
MTTTAKLTPQSLSDRLLIRLQSLLTEADAQTKPLEHDPFRSQLFELFVTAEGAGYLRRDADPDLSPEGLCRTLGERWGLAQAAKDATDNQTPMSQDHLRKMRLLWSLSRMWMEWDYAWRRWDEFHPATDDAAGG